MRRKRGLGYYLALYRLGKKRFRSENDYLELEVFQGRDVLNHLSNLGFDAAGREVLEAGCGYGGISFAFAEAGAKVTAIDNEKKVIEFARSKVGGGIVFLQRDAEKTGMESGSFDLIVASSIIEHVRSPERFLGEMERLLRPEGLLYLCFPPWFSFNGGHALKPFHLVPEKILFLFARVFGREKTVVEEMANLNKLTVGRLLDILRNTGFETVRVSEKFLPFSFFAKIPFLREFLSLSVEFVLRKKRKE